MDSGKQAYAVEYDLSNCESEPIHLIRLVQSHACLIACNLPDLKILQVSDNIEKFTGHSVEKSLESILPQLLDKVTMGLIQEGLSAPNGFKTLNPIRAIINKNKSNPFYNIIAHVNEDGLLILEIEPIGSNISTSTFQYLLSNAIQKVQLADADTLFEVTAKEIKAITGYDRVMVYRFDEEYNGEVIAEAKETFVESYLGLRYPASDIPKQARALFLKNKVRLTGDVKSEPARVVPLVHPVTKQPLDMTHTVARGVSPIHLEYLANMGVGATLSIAIILNDQLWGLIACHHFSPKYLDYSLRVTCQFIGQIFSGHLALQSANLYRDSVLKSNIIRTSLFEKMSSDYDIFGGLTEDQNAILDLVNCTGAAVVTEHRTALLGTTPNESEIKEIIKWLEDKTDKAVFSTDELPNIFPPALAFKEKATGLMAIKFAINPSEFVLWFRPETIQEVYWGGNPKKAIVSTKEGVRLSPRKSFDKWKDLLQNTARPWQKFERDTAIALRNDIKDFIVQKFNEIKQLNKKMEEAYKELESFSYSVSHDLRAPLRNIDGFAQILKEDFSENLDDYGLEVLDTIIESTGRMNALINDILSFSKLGRATMIFNELDTNNLLEPIIKSVTALIPKTSFDIAVPKNMPALYGDESLLTQLFTNVLSNAIKYSSRAQKAIIEITSSETEEFVTIAIKDNGIGFDMKYAGKIFGVFNRLVSEDDFEGTGIGLAIVHRVTDKHGGQVMVESKKDIGTTFFVKLPKKDYSPKNSLPETAIA